jgi:hypothetical membrane protein
MPERPATQGPAVPETGVGADRHLLAWGLTGVLAQTAFLAGWLIAGTWQPRGYSLVKNTISDMQAATAPHAWFPVACFAVGGLGTLGFAIFGLRPALARAGKRAAYAPWMLAVAGLAIGNSFPLVPCQRIAAGCTAAYVEHSPGGMTDDIVASIAFLVLVITPFPLWQRLKALPEWRKLRPVMITARVIGPVFFILLVAFSNSGPEGLAERILAATLSLWVGALAITLVSNTRQARAGPANVPPLSARNDPSGEAARHRHHLRPEQDDLCARPSPATDRHPANNRRSGAGGDRSPLALRSWRCPLLDDPYPPFGASPIKVRIMQTWPFCACQSRRDGYAIRMSM